jgi:hypothetical protein
MSKTLFNQNTFNDKNVTNSNNIDDIKIDTLKVTNATITNLTNTELQTATSNISDLQTNKQDNLTAGDGINLTEDSEISLDGTRTGDFRITGEFESEGIEFKLWNPTRGGVDGEGNPTSNGRVFVHTGSGTKASSTLRINYLEDFGAGTQIDGDTTITGDLAINGVSNVATEIAGKEDAFVVSEFNPLKKDTTNSPYLLYVATDTSPTLGSNDVVTSGGLYQYLIDNYNAKLTNGSSLQLSIDDTGSGIDINDEISVILATSASASDFGLVTGNLLNSELSSKQDTLSAGDGININGSNEISLSGTRTGNFIITGNFQSGGTDFKMYNTTRGGVDPNGDPQSDGRALVHTNTGTASKATSILRLNYNADFGAGTQIDSIVGIKTTPDSSYDLKVNGNVDIGGVLSIDGYANVRTALDNATGGGTYTAEANGGLAVNASNEFSIDLTNTNDDFAIPQRVVISTDTTDGHLVVQPSSSTGQDAIVKIIGRRNGSTTSRQAQLRFQNYDENDGASGSTANLGEISGVVQNSTTNIGGLQFYNFADGSTRGTAMTMNYNGRFHMGNSFQDTYKLQVTGNTNFTGDAIIGGTLQIDGVSNVRTAIEGKQDPISALSGGGLAISNNEISVDFSNTSANIQIPQRVVIEDDTTAQLIVKTVTSGNDAAITIRGERNTTTNRQAQLRLENTLSGSTNDLAEIAGVVTNAGSNIGGLGIYNFANGSTRTEAMMMNENGRFHFGSTFQDDYKLQVTGNTNFTGDTNVGGDLNLTGLLVCDNTPVNDDINRILLYDGSTGDYGFGINSNTLTYHSNVNHRFIYGSTTAGGGTTGMELSNSNLTVNGNLSVGGNPNKRIAIINMRKYEADGGLWGNGAWFDFAQNKYRIGASFCSESNGVITLNTSGTYKISVSVQVENISYDNRVVVGTYVSINNNTGNWRNQANSGRFGLTYIRHDDYGFGGSQSYSDYYELDSGQNIRVRTMLGEGSDARNYNDTENDNNIHLYGRLEIELISTTDLVESGV